MPARFFRFPRSPFIYLPECKEVKQKRKEKEENAVAFALRQVAVEAQRIEVYPVTEGRCFVVLSENKEGLKSCGPHGMHSPATWEIRYTVDSPVGRITI